MSGIEIFNCANSANRHQTFIISKDMCQSTATIDGIKTIITDSISMIHDH